MPGTDTCRARLSSDVIWGGLRRKRIGRPTECTTWVRDKAWARATSLSRANVWIMSTALVRAWAWIMAKAWFRAKAWLRAKEWCMANSWVRDKAWLRSNWISGIYLLKRHTPGNSALWNLLPQEVIGESPPC